MKFMTEPVRGLSAPSSLSSLERHHLLQEAASHHRAACEAIGRDVDLYSEMELQPILFEELELPPTPDRRTDTESLSQLRGHPTIPFVEHLLAYRETMGFLGDVG